MEFLKIKQNKVFDDFREQARYELALRLLVFFIIGSIALTINAILTKSAFIEFFFAGFVVIVLATIWLVKRQKLYKIIMGILLAILNLLVYGSIVFVSGDLHYNSPFLLLAIGLASYYIHGINWGAVLLGLNSIVFFLFYQYFYIDIESFDKIINANGFSTFTSVEFILTLFILGFVMHNYSVLNNTINSRQINAILALNKRKKSVEKKKNEKTVLIQEIHHRVKNNLQVIISLLRMQSNLMQTEEARVHFGKAIGRLMTLSLMHQKMYENKTLNEINLEDYIENLVKDLLYASSKRSIVQYQLEIDVKHIDFDRIISIGLIINELITNSIQGNEEEQNITIKITQEKNGDIKMAYNSDKETLVVKDAFSLNLIQIFSDQIGGEYTQKNEKLGTTYYFNFYGETM